MIASLLSNIPRDQRLTVHVVHFEDEAMSEENISKLSSLKNTIRDFNLAFIPFDRKKIENFKNEFWHKAILVKLFAADIFENLDEIIWIDDDVVVVGNVAEVYDFDMKDKYLAAVDLSYYYTNYSNEKCDYWLTAGFGFYNLKNMRRDGIKDVLLRSCEYYTKNSEEIKKERRIVGGIEEYALTDGIPREKVFLLPHEYSIMSFLGLKGTYFEDISENIKNGKIIHFAGLDKPWKNHKIKGIHPFFYSLWREYFKMTPYFDENKKFGS
jgi:lipopolysaccharide biosynthesis glycosyltransferase